MLLHSTLDYHVFWEDIHDSEKYVCKPDFSKDFSKAKVNQYIKACFKNIDRAYGKSAYNLERGEAIERLVAEVLGLYGLNASPYGQVFIAKDVTKGVKGNKEFIKCYQRDLRVEGGLSGRHYPVEVKERNGGCASVFSKYQTIAVGKQENWDLKNLAVVNKPGFKETLAVILVDTFTQEMLVAYANLEDQDEWRREYRTY
jgi:hypothetical protein